MRYELADFERASIKPFPPNNPRGVLPVNDRRVLNGIRCRRVATCCDKLAANDLAFIRLASIRLWLHVNGSTP